MTNVSNAQRFVDVNVDFAEGNGVRLEVERGDIEVREVMVVMSDGR